MCFSWIIQPLKTALSKARLLILSLLAWIFALALSAVLGAEFAGAVESPYGMVDPVDARYEANYSVYVEQCASCHVALPPAVLPIESWQTLVTDTAHYGVQLNLTQLDQQLMVNYLQTYSRRHIGSGPIPYRVKDSDYFQALHPNVELPQPVNLRSCTSCHINASNQDYSFIEPSEIEPSENVTPKATPATSQQ